MCDNARHSVTKERVHPALALVAGGLAAIPTLLLFVLLPSTPITLVGAGYLAAAVLLVVALLTLSWRRQRFRWLGRLALLGLVLIATLRLAVPAKETSLTALTGPEGDGARWVSRLFDEQDIVLFGERVASRLGLISARENTGPIDALARGYATMREEGASTRSPFLNTALGQQAPDRYDVLVAEPPRSLPARGAVIFLHGYGGNFALQCWLVARPALRLEMVTVCPSTGVRGDWWTERGARIVRSAIGRLRERGIEHVYLAGISNGGVGVSRLAPALQDERMPAYLLERYADAAGDRAEAHIVAGDHFVLLKRADELQAILARWLAHHQDSW
jgi:hypothetical protein